MKAYLFLLGMIAIVLSGCHSSNQSGSDAGYNSSFDQRYPAESRPMNSPPPVPPRIY